MNNRYDINSDGENNLLIALREQDLDAFQEYLSAEVDPFTPSKYAQCSAGMVRHFPEFPLIDYRDWEFDPNGTEVFAQQRKHQSAFQRHCTKDLQAYITPQMGGLHLAAALNIVTVIDQRKAEVNARDAWGYTPIMYALGCCNYHATIALQNLASTELVRQGSLNLLPEQILTYGRSWIPERIKKIVPLKDISPFAVPINKAVTIHQAALTGDMEALKRLLELGVPINIRSFNGSSPLLCACLNGQKEVCDYLLDHGADPYLPNYVGETAWQFFDAHQKAPIEERTLSETSDQLCNQLEELLQPDTVSTDTEPTPEVPVSTVEEGAAEEIGEVEENKTEETVGKGESFSTQFLDSALSGDFHSMVTLYFLMDKPRELAKEVLNSSDSINCEKRELITDWLKFNIIEDILEEDKLKKSYSPLLLLSVDNKDLFLHYFKNQSKINQEISRDNYLLTIAARSKAMSIFNWLLRHGATMRLGGNILPNLRETNPIHLKQDFLESFEIFRDRRREEISDNPKLIPDLLLYSLTTNNIEIIEDYFSDGLSLKATTKDGLSLVDIARLIDSTELESILLMHSGKEKLALAVTAITSTVATEEEENPGHVVASSSNASTETEPQETEPDPLNWFKDGSNSATEESIANKDSLSTESTTNNSHTSSDFESEEDDALANQWFGNTESAEEPASFSSDESESGDFFFTAELEGSFFGSGNEASESEPETSIAQAEVKDGPLPADTVDIKDYLPRIRINRHEELKQSDLEEILFRLPFPKPVLRLFLTIQNNDDETLLSKINNKQTLELFWMFKLYVDRKINKD